MKKEYKEAYHIGHHVDDMMRLPFVIGCTKQPDGSYVYSVRGVEDRTECYEGEWIVLTSIGKLMALSEESFRSIATASTA